MSLADMLGVLVVRGGKSQIQRTVKYHVSSKVRTTKSFAVFVVGQ